MKLINKTTLLEESFSEEVKKAAEQFAKDYEKFEPNCVYIAVKDNCVDMMMYLYPYADEILRLKFLEKSTKEQFMLEQHGAETDMREEVHAVLA